jgi:hypothetical protein
MWYNKIVADLGHIPDFIAYYERELQQAKYDTVRCHPGTRKNIPMAKMRSLILRLSLTKLLYLETNGLVL